ncbi:uncharacterized protein LOC115921431 [Strongylocentrotus purpuratus]|uniref:Reverse transcriptase domain-containing protein n=1 Tax=Strongylocentrotus purpuratus TaxID=7668 RepID=A0A7M7NFF4_STRPU|nr:uncharacterized protein LOC115921431 [Strongylocentrotus purpuratus]
METTGQSEDIEKATKKLKKHGITDIYDVPHLDGNRSDETRLQWLHLLHGCLKKGDEGMSADLIKLYSFPRFEWLWKQGRKDVTEALKRHGEDIREEEEEAKKLLRGRITDLEQELNESRTSCASIVSENGRLQDTMKIEQERREHSERAMMENEKRAKQIKETYTQKEMEYEKKLQSKDLRIETMAENVQGTEEKARRQVERLEIDNEEMMTKLVSKLQWEDTLTKMLEEKERNETTLKQRKGWILVSTLAEECQDLTTFRTPFGRYCFQRVPFGLCTSQDIIQQHMDRIVQNVPGCVCIADDIAIVGKTKEEHDKNLHLLMETAKQEGLVFNSSKLSIQCLHPRTRKMFRDA